MCAAAARTRRKDCMAMPGPGVLHGGFEVQRLAALRRVGLWRLQLAPKERTAWPCRGRRFCRGGLRCRGWRRCGRSGLWRGPRGCLGKEASAEAAGCGHSWPRAGEATAGNWKLQRRFEGFEGAKRHVLCNGKEGASAAKVGGGPRSGGFEGAKGPSRKRAKRLCLAVSKGSLKTVEKDCGWP